MADDGKSTQQILRALEDRGLDPSGLEPVGVRPTLSAYIAQLWERRHFIWMDARQRVATQNSRNRLGSAWLVLRPLLDAMLYVVIFGFVIGADRDVDNFVAFVVIGIMMFRSTMRSISSGPSVIRSNKAMIRAFSFPRASLPISAELRDALQMQYTIGIVLVVIMAIPPHETPQISWLLVVPIYIMQFMLNLGITFVMARVGFLFPDVSQFMAVVARFLRYASGIIFPIDRFLDHPGVIALLEFNPIYQMVTMYRQALMDGVVPGLESWLIFGGWSVGLLVFGFVFFWQGEVSYGGED